MDDHYPVRSAFSLLNMVLTFIPEIPTCLCFWFMFSLSIVSRSQSLFFQFSQKFVSEKTGKLYEWHYSLLLSTTHHNLQLHSTLL